MHYCSILLFFLVCSWAFPAWAQSDYVLLKNTNPYNSCISSEPPMFVQSLANNKSATLTQIKNETFAILQSHLNDSQYAYKTDYAYVQIGNFLAPGLKHALIVYVSDCYQNSSSDYRANLHLYEALPTGIWQEVNLVNNLSIGYQKLEIEVGDILNSGGRSCIAINTAEPEWYHNSTPLNRYRHILLFDTSTKKLQRLQGFENYPNPQFLSPQLFFTYEQCGCAGECYTSSLYQYTPSGVALRAKAEARCAITTTIFDAQQGKNAKVAEEYGVSSATSVSTMWEKYAPFFFRQ